MHGKTVRLAMDEGFKHAMTAIIDSNVTTVLTALFLYQFGTGPVKGFAVTLIVGIVASMVTAIFVTRTFFLIWLQRRPDHVHAEHLTCCDSSPTPTTTSSGSGATPTASRPLILVPGLLFLLVKGLNYSIEFTGGTLVQVQSKKPVDVGRAPDRPRPRRASTGAEIQKFGAPNEYVIRARVAKPGTDANDTQATADAVRQALDAVLGAGQLHGASAPRRWAPRSAASSGRRRSSRSSSSFFAVLAYLAYRFEWRFGLAAVIATAHDILATSRSSR